LLYALIILPGLSTHEESRSDMYLRHFVPRAGLAGLALAAAACGDSTGVGRPGVVSVDFRVSGSGGVVAAAPGPTTATAPQRVAGPPLVIAGTNGTLTIDEILIIIDEVELHRADGSCDDDGPLDDDCGDFETPPRFLDLPLDGEPLAGVTTTLPAGAYKSLDFEVEDLEDDESDPAKAAAIEAVRAQILAIVPDWPRKASTLVTGSFAPSAGGSIDFRVFLEAEIEVELDLVPTLVVSEDGEVSRDITVDVAPEIWFRRADGSVLPLHLYDYDQTNQLLEFELEMEDGFTEIEFD